MFLGFTLKIISWHFVSTWDPIFQLVLHTGAKAKANPNQSRLDDPQDLLKRAAKDRCMIAIESGADAADQFAEVVRIGKALDIAAMSSSRRIRSNNRLQRTVRCWTGAIICIQEACMSDKELTIHVYINNSNIFGGAQTTAGKPEAHVPWHQPSPVGTARSSSPSPGARL